MNEKVPQHIAGEHDLSKYPLYIRNLEQSDSFLRGGFPRILVGVPMRLIEVAVSERPPHTTWWIEMGHLHIRFEGFTN